LSLQRPLTFAQTEFLKGGIDTSRIQTKISFKNSNLVNSPKF
jgi:hypothetical protein